MDKLLSNLLTAVADAKENYSKKGGLQNINKSGEALTSFNSFVEASGKCWDELRNDKYAIQERIDFFNKFKDIFTREDMGNIT